MKKKKKKKKKKKPVLELSCVSVKGMISALCCRKEKR